MDSSVEHTKDTSQQPKCDIINEIKVYGEELQGNNRKIEELHFRNREILEHLKNMRSEIGKTLSTFEPHASIPIDSISGLTQATRAALSNHGITDLTQLKGTPKSKWGSMGITNPQQDEIQAALDKHFPNK